MTARRQGGTPGKRRRILTPISPPLPLYAYAPVVFPLVMLIALGLSHALGWTHPAPTTYQTVCVAIVVGAGALMIMGGNARKNQFLVSCTTQFLLKGDASSLDELLGALIAGTTKIKEADAVKVLFECLDQRTGLDSGYEEKRRIAEALPALFSIDIARTKEIALALRKDWDEKRWHADNRRRVIEAIPRTAKMDNDTAFKEDMLRLVPRDDEYVVLVCAEVLHGLTSQLGAEHVGKLFEQLLHDMSEAGFDKKITEQIKHVWFLLGLFGEKDAQALKQCQHQIDNGQHLVRVFVARNTHRFSESATSEMFQLMENCLRDDQNKNVRRPMARKSSMDALKELLHSRAFRDKAQNMILRLVRDNDDIIATTSFDKVDTVFDADEETGRKMISAGLESGIDMVRTRAARAARRHAVTVATP